MGKRVRHHSNDRGLNAIRDANAITSGRGWGPVATGVHVEVEPFASACPSTTGGPKADLGCNKEGAFVGFDAPENMLHYHCGPRNSAVIPVPLDETLCLNGLKPAVCDSSISLVAILEDPGTVTGSRV
jgi:hypothetical protein